MNTTPQTYTVMSRLCSNSDFLTFAFDTQRQIYSQFAPTSQAWEEHVVVFSRHEREKCSILEEIQIYEKSLKIMFFVHHEHSCLFSTFCLLDEHPERKDKHQKTTCELTFVLGKVQKIVYIMHNMLAALVCNIKSLRVADSFLQVSYLWQCS